MAKGRRWQQVVRPNDGLEECGDKPEHWGSARARGYVKGRKGVVKTVEVEETMLDIRDETNRSVKCGYCRHTTLSMQLVAVTGGRLNMHDPVTCDTNILAFKLPN